MINTIEAENEQHITIVDSIMGSGKTSWAIQYMNSNPDKSFIFVTPFLEQIERIKKNSNRVFYDPKNWERTKRDDFNVLIEDGRDIAVTHCTFSHANEETIRLLRESHYTLIIDEAVDVLVDFNIACGDSINKDDIKMLFNERFISAGTNGKVSWLKQLYPNIKYWKYWKVEHCARNGNLFYLNEAFLVWQFPPEIFSLFDDIYIMTYLFSGSMMAPYFQIHGIGYQMATIEKDANGNYRLAEWKEDLAIREHYKALISIYEDKPRKDDGLKDPKAHSPIGQSMNDYRNFALSKTWYDRNGGRAIDRLKKNMDNYRRNVAKADAKRIMWTCYETHYKQLKGKGYTQTRKLTSEESQYKGVKRKQAGDRIKCFVPCNARATNDFADRDVLMYMINLCPNEYMMRYFGGKRAPDGTELRVDRDTYSLANCLQWIWRSAIRDDKPIQIYIPSTRMRELLKDWLNGTR